MYVQIDVLVYVQHTTEVVSLGVWRSHCTHAVENYDHLCGKFVKPICRLRSLILPPPKPRQFAGSKIDNCVTQSHTNLSPNPPPIYRPRPRQLTCVIRQIIWQLFIRVFYDVLPLLMDKINTHQNNCSYYAYTQRVISDYWVFMACIRREIV